MGIPVPVELTPPGPGSAAPLRRPGSVRRTATLDFTWVGDLRSDVIMDGRGRDLLTRRDGSVETLAEAALELVTDERRTIRSIGSRPEVVGLQALVGASAMSGFRTLLAEAVAGDALPAGPLHQLLDDVPGASLVSGAAFRPFYELTEYTELRREVSQRVVTDICTGYQRGSSALNPDGTMRWGQLNWHVAPSIERGDDRLGWHDLAPHPAGTASMRRAKRTDVWLEDGVIRIDAFYQDSALEPQGERLSIHEYTLTAEADLETTTLRSIRPVARVVPYRECPLATLHAPDLVGEPLAGLRRTVLERLAGPPGCTHLNDTMRAFADVPALVERLLDASV